MRFKINGQFETETLIDVAQRITAELQDAGALRVAGINVYLSVVDRHGVSRSLTLGCELVETLSIDCSDLALDVPAPKLAVGRASSPMAGPKPRRPANRRRGA